MHTCQVFEWVGDGPETGCKGLIPQFLDAMKSCSSLQYRSRSPSNTIFTLWISRQNFEYLFGLAIFNLFVGIIEYWLHFFAWKPISGARHWYGNRRVRGGVTMLPCHHHLVTVMAPTQAVRRCWTDELLPASDLSQILGNENDQRKRVPIASQQKLRFVAFPDY